MNKIIATTAVAGLAVVSLTACSAIPSAGWKSDVRASVEASTYPDPEACESMQWLGVDSGTDMAAMLGLTPEMVDYANTVGAMAADPTDYSGADFSSVPDDKYGDALLYAVEVAYEVTCS